MPLAALFCALDDDRSFYFPRSPIASEQHCSRAPPPKLALLQRNVKINVAYQSNNCSRAVREPVPGARSSILYRSRNHYRSRRIPLAKHSKSTPAGRCAVRTRRAYFDCRFGQLHVRTAFPATGGFDEQVTLVLPASARGFEPRFRALLCPRSPTCARSTRRICPAAANPIPRPARASPRPPRQSPIWRMICGCARSICWDSLAAPQWRWTLPRRDRRWCAALVLLGSRRRSIAGRRAAGADHADAARARRYCRASGPLCRTASSSSR